MRYRDLLASSLSAHMQFVRGEIHSPGRGIKKNQILDPNRMSCDGLAGNGEENVDEAHNRCASGALFLLCFPPRNCPIQVWRWRNNWKRRQHTYIQTSTQRSSSETNSFARCHKALGGLLVLDDSAPCSRGGRGVTGRRVKG